MGVKRGPCCPWRTRLAASAWEMVLGTLFSGQLQHLQIRTFLKEQ